VGMTLHAAAVDDTVERVEVSPLSAGGHSARGLALFVFCAGYRDVEELLAERRLDLSYETVRCWVIKFGPVIARDD